MTQCYYKLFYDFKEQTEALSDAERGRLIIAIIDYAREGIELTSSGRESVLFPVFKAQIDREMAKAAMLAENGRKGGEAKSTKQAEANDGKPKQTVANCSKPKQTVANCHNKEKEKEEEKDKEKDSGGVTRAREDAPPPLPYGLTDADIAESLERDRTLEQTARECGLPTAPANMMTARDLCNEHTLDTVILAMRRAADGKSQTWGYVKGILRRWREQGGVDSPQRKRPDHSPAAAAYTQREYTEAQLNAGTADLLREAMEVGA